MTRSSASPEIRIASLAERSRLLDLWLDLVEYHRLLDPDFPALPSLREVLGEEIERGLASDTCRIFVANEGEKPVAFLFAESRPDGESDPEGRGRIEELYVDPAWRGLGVGRALVDAASTWLRLQGARRVSVRVENGNTTGQMFWQQLGFAERARILETAL